MARTFFRLDSPELLDALLKKAGLSNVTAGQACNHVDGSYVSRLRRGHRKSVTPFTAQRLAELLGVDVSLLFTEHSTRDGVVVPPSAISRGTIAKPIGAGRAVA